MNMFLAGVVIAFIVAITMVALVLLTTIAQLKDKIVEISSNYPIMLERTAKIESVHERITMMVASLTMLINTLEQLVASTKTSAPTNNGGHAQGPSVQSMFATSDGKIKAKTPKEFLDKLKESGEYDALVDSIEEQLRRFDEDPSKFFDELDEDDEDESPHF